MDAINDVIEQLTKASGLDMETLIKLLKTLSVLLLAPIVQWIILGIIRRRAADPTTVYRGLVVLRYTLGAAVLITLAFIWISGVQELATYISIVSAGLLIALQDTVSNLAGFVFIVVRKPFQLGDRIEIDGLAGDVVDIRIFQFTVVEIKNWVDADQSTGRIVHIPNRKVMIEAIANYTTGFEYIWDEVGVLVTFESDWRNAKQILWEIAQQHCEQFSPQAEEQLRRTAQRYMIIAGKLTPIVYTTVRDSGVLLTLRYLTKARQRRGNAQSIWEAILDAFAEHDNIDFAYPTTRFYDNHREGKPGARSGRESALPDQH